LTTRLLGVELARRIEDFLGEGGADHVHELLQSVIGIAEAELCGRHREA
jgi:hypothetical protein